MPSVWCSCTGHLAKCHLVSLCTLCHMTVNVDPGTLDEATKGKTVVLLSLR